MSEQIYGDMDPIKHLIITVQVLNGLKEDLKKQIDGIVKILALVREAPDTELIFKNKALKDLKKKELQLKYLEVSLNQLKGIITAAQNIDKLSGEDDE